MGQKLFLYVTLLVGAILTLSAERGIPGSAQQPGPVYDSTALKQDSIFICRSHYFEWDRDSAVCPYDLAPMEKVDLWEYYLLLECEECKDFFDAHYAEFTAEIE